jgi:hypothetical protein
MNKFNAKRTNMNKALFGSVRFVYSPECNQEIHNSLTSKVIFIVLIYYRQFIITQLFMDLNMLIQNKIINNVKDNIQ